MRLVVLLLLLLLTVLGEFYCSVLGLLFRHCPIQDFSLILIDYCDDTFNYLVIDISSFLGSNVYE